MILKWIFKYWNGGVDWIDLTQDRDRSRALVIAAKNPRVPFTAGNSSTSCGTDSF